MKIKFYGEMQKLFGKEVSLSITEHDNIARCLDCIKPGFLKYILNSLKNGTEFYMYSPDLDKVVFPEDLPKLKDLTLDFLVQPQGNLAGVGGMLAGFGQGFAMQWLMNKLNKKKKSGLKKYERVSTNSYIYNQNKNLVEQGAAIPAGYGQLRIGTKTVSSSVRNYDFDWKSTQIYQEALTNLDVYNFGYLQNLESTAIDEDYQERSDYNISDDTRRVVRIGSDGAQVPQERLGNARVNSSSNDATHGGGFSQATEIITPGNRESKGGDIGFADSQSAVMPSKPSALSKNSEPYEYSFRPNDSTNPTVRIASATFNSTNNTYGKQGNWNNLTPYNTVGSRGEWSTRGKGKLESISLHRSVELLCEGPIAGLALPVTGNEYHGQQVLPEPIAGGISSAAFNRRASVKPLTFNGIGGINFNGGNTLAISQAGKGYEVGNVYEGGTKSIADMIEVDPPVDSSPATIPSFNGPAMTAKDDNFYGSIYEYDPSDGSIDFISDNGESWFNAFESYIGPGSVGVKIKNYIDNKGELETYQIGEDNLNIVKKDFSMGNGYATNQGTVRATISPANSQATLGSGILPDGSTITSDQGPSATLIDTDRRRCRAEFADFANASHKNIVSIIKATQYMNSYSADLYKPFQVSQENGGPNPLAPYTANDETSNIGAAPTQVARIVPDSFAGQINLSSVITFVILQWQKGYCSNNGPTTGTITFTGTVSQILNCFETGITLGSFVNGTNGSSAKPSSCGGIGNSRRCGSGVTYNPGNLVSWSSCGSGSLPTTTKLSTLIVTNGTFRSLLYTHLVTHNSSARFSTATQWIFHGVGAGSTFRTNFNATACVGGRNTFAGLHIYKDGSNELDFTNNKKGFYKPNTFPRIQVYVVRRYREVWNGPDQPTNYYIHVCPTLIEAVGRVNSEGKIQSAHLIRVPDNPVIDQKIVTRDPDEYRTNPNNARTQIWPHSESLANNQSFPIFSQLKTKINAGMNNMTAQIDYQDLGVILQTDDSRIPLKELLFTTQQNTAKTLSKLSGADPMWNQFAGSYFNYMTRGGSYDVTATQHSPCHYAAPKGDTYKMNATWQGAGFSSNTTVDVDADIAINPLTEEDYDPIKTTLVSETVSINTSTDDAFKAKTDYRRDGLESVIGSAASKTIYTGRIKGYNVNNAGNDTDFRYKTILSNGTSISLTFVKERTFGISPNSGDDIQRFDIANKGSGYRPNYGNKNTRFIVYGRPTSLDTPAKRKLAVAKMFNCSVNDTIADEVFAYTFKGVVSITSKGEVNRISVIDCGMAFDDEMGNGLPITIESLSHLSPGTSNQLGNHAFWIRDAENDAFMSPANHWSTSRVLDSNVVGQAKSDLVMTGNVLSSGNDKGKVTNIIITSNGSGFTLNDRFDVKFNEAVSSGATVPAYDPPTFSVVVVDNAISSITLTSNGSGYGTSDSVVPVRMPKPTKVNTATTVQNPVDSYSWASCVYLDDVPIRDKFGRFNFSKFDIDLKTGNIHNGSDVAQKKLISFDKAPATAQNQLVNKILKEEYRVPLQTKDVNYFLYGPRNQGQKDYFYSYDIKNRNVSAVILSIEVEKLFYIYEGDSETVYVNFAPALFGAIGFFIGQKLGEMLLNEIFSNLFPDIGVTAPGTWSGCMSGPTSPQKQIGMSPWNLLKVGAKVASFFITTALALAGMALGHILGQKVKCSTMKFLCIKVGNKIENSGEYWPARVEFVVEYFLEGQSTITRKMIQVNGIATSKYVRDIIIDDLPEPAGDNQNRIIRIFRVTREMDPVVGGEKEARYNMSANLKSVTEVVEGVFSYPHTSLIATRTNSKDFSNIPNKEYLLKLKKVKIPSNYNPEVGMDLIEATDPHLDAMYNGVWDGKFKQHAYLGAGGSNNSSEIGFFWTNNPAWIIYDLITDKTFGAGKYGINPESVDKWSFYKFAQRCDELVDVAVGNSTEKEKDTRATFT